MRSPSEVSDCEEKRLEHMRRRRAHGLTFRELEEEFDEGKSTIHRKLKPEHEEDD